MVCQMADGSVNAVDWLRLIILYGMDHRHQIAPFVAHRKIVARQRALGASVHKLERLVGTVTLH